MFRHLLAVMLVTTAVATPLAAAAPETPPVPDPGARNESSTKTTERPDRMRVPISPATYVVDYRFTDGTWHITVRSEISTTVTVAEVTRLEDGGAATFAIRQYEIDRGTTTIVFQAERIRGIAAITLTTPESIEAGQGAYIQVGDATGNPLADSKPSMAWLGGAGIAVLSFVGAALFVIRREQGEPKQK